MAVATRITDAGTSRAAAKATRAADSLERVRHPMAVAARYALPSTGGSSAPKPTRASD